MHQNSSHSFPLLKKHLAAKSSSGQRFLGGIAAAAFKKSVTLAHPALQYCQVSQCETLFIVSNFSLPPPQLSSRIT